MITFHPDENMLLEYGAGSLEWALSISIKTHLSMCPACSRKVTHLNAIGSAFFEQLEPTETPESHDESTSFEKLMQRIDMHDFQAEDLSEIRAPLKKPAYRELPEVVQRILPADGTLNWRRLSPSLKEARLISGQNQFEVSLHKIKRGGKVAEHDHGGREVTVVLKGSFSDENGTYQPGDFVMCEPGQKHRPTATQNQDCLCLSVVEAPVKLTGLLGKAVNPFLTFNPC